MLKIKAAPAAPPTLADALRSLAEAVAALHTSDEVVGALSRAGHGEALVRAYAKAMEALAANAGGAR